MKILKNIIVVLIAGVFTAGLALNFGGCSKQLPLGPESLSTQEGLQFISLGKGLSSLKKVIEVTEWVTWENGGELILEYKGKNTTTGTFTAKSPSRYSPKRSVRMRNCA